MRVLVREWTHWAAGYGLPHAALKTLARRGDPFAQLLTIDTSPDSDIYPLLEQVRARGRMSRVARVGWVSADAQIVREVLRDGRFRTIKPRDRSPFRILQWLVAKTTPDVSNPLELPSMLVTDPPEHTRLRRLVSRAFTPRALDGLRTRVRDIAEELLGNLEGRSDCDLIAEYTAQIPLAVIAEMLAIPRDETDNLLAVAKSTTRVIGTTAASWRDFRSATTAMHQFDQYMAAHVQRLKRDDSNHSILSDVMRNSDLTEPEIRTLAGLLLGAGFITTTHVFGKAVVALVRHPEQLAALRANPEGWPNAVEEILRFDTTGQLTGRVATEPVDIQGYSVKAADPVFLLVGGANRDPAVFANPGSFDTTRANAREHISFGNGAHTCLGAALARMELRIGLQSLFERFPALSLADEPVFNDHLGLHGLTYLRVSLGAVNAGKINT